MCEPHMTLPIDSASLTKLVEVHNLCLAQHDAFVGSQTCRKAEGKHRGQKRLQVIQTAFTHPAPVQKSALMPSEATLHTRQSMEQEGMHARARPLGSACSSACVCMRYGLKMLLTRLSKKYTRSTWPPACALALQPSPMSR